MGPPYAIPAAVRRGDLVVYTERLAAVIAGHWPDANSIIWKGSAYKPWDGPYDFLPGLSDLDLHVYRSGGLEDPWALRRIVFDAVGSPPGDTPLQLLVLDSDDLPSPWSLWEGSYRVLYGGPPSCDLQSEDELRASDLEQLIAAQGRARQIREGVIDRTDDQLWQYLRRVRWMFPPVLYRAASVGGHSPRTVWPMNRTALLELTLHDAGLSAIRAATIRYYQAALAAGSRPGYGDASEEALRQGHDLLVIAAEWADSHRGTISDE